MPVSGDRFAWLEWPARDFPFYAGSPVRISVAQWLLLMALVVAGYLGLVLPIPWPFGAWGLMLPAVLTAALPLLGLHLVAPGQWRRLFYRVTARDLKWMLLFAALNIVVSVCMALLVQSFAAVKPNQAFAVLEDAGRPDQVLFFTRTLAQLLGEELITVLPFLALMALLTQGCGLGRKPAIVVAWLLSALWFGLLHLPTYGWNVVQCVAIIGTARLVLTLPWIMGKNLWVSAGAHILNDWALFLFALAVGKASV